MKNFRYLLRVLAVAVIVLAGTYAGYWFLTARNLQAGLERWASARRAEGYTVAWDRVSIEGFPLAFRIVLAGGVIARGDDYRVALPTVVGTAWPGDLTRWHLAAPGGASGAVRGLAAVIAARSLTGDIVLGADATILDASMLQLTGAGAAAGQVTAHLAMPRRAPRGHDQVGLAAALRLFHLTLPRPVTALGDTIENCAVDIRVMGAVPTGDWRTALAAWRDQGGTVELTDAALQWGALRLEADGTVALDSALQPMAALSATVVDQSALVDAAVAGDLLPARNARMVKLVLGLLARRGPDGQSRLTAPVTLQDGILSVGRAEIGKVPPIEWK